MSSQTAGETTVQKDLRVLIVEDSEEDALLMVRRLKKGGYEPDHERVETAEAMRKALTEKEWDLILCDYSLPNFSGLKAITLTRDMGFDLPIIVVSGVIGEETAVDTMKAGASDYVMKGNLLRLVPAVERELKEALIRQDRKRISMALEASEQKFRKIFDGSPVAVAVTSIKEETLVDVNDEYINLTQFSREELIGKQPIDLGLWVNPEERQALVETIKSSGRVKGFPVTIRTKSGKIASLLFAADVIDIAGDQCMISSALDITERKRIEDDLRSSEKRLAEIIEFFPDATLVIDRDGRVVAWNRAMESMTGVAKSEMIGKGDYQYAVPLYGQRRPILIDLALNDQADAHSVYTDIRRRGDIIFGEAYAPCLPVGRAHLSATASVLRDLKGGIVAAIECIRDNTETKKAQEALQEAEEKYRSIFENAQEGIHRSTPDGRIILANRAMAEIFGYDSPEELMALITDVAKQMYVHPEERDKLKAILEKQGIVKNFEVELYKKDGTPIWVSLTLRAVRNNTGQVNYFEGLNKDITERKLSSERMRRALGATISAITYIVEVRDPYTAGHQRRVGELACAIAAEMALSVDLLEGIRTAAIIHDLGKISIPAEILSKPTRLTALEFDLIKTHAQAGYDILKEIDFPWPVARMILEHHERMDGSGYPLGLKGNETLLESRIIQVADVVESMASHRPYRPSLGIEAALAEIEEHQGAQYDSDVVKACLRLFRKHGYRLV